MFRSFAEKLAEGMPSAFAYETPKLWNVAKGGKKLLSVSELLDSSAAVRTALEILNVAMKTAAETCRRLGRPRRDRVATGRPAQLLGVGSV